MKQNTKFNSRTQQPGLNFCSSDKGSYDKILHSTASVRSTMAVVKPHLWVINFATSIIQRMIEKTGSFMYPMLTKKKATVLCRIDISRLSAAAQEPVNTKFCCSVYREKYSLRTAVWIGISHDEEGVRKTGRDFTGICCQDSNGDSQILHCIPNYREEWILADRFLCISQEHDCLESICNPISFQP